MRLVVFARVELQLVAIQIYAVLGRAAANVARVEARIEQRAAAVVLRQNVVIGVRIGGHVAGAARRVVLRVGRVGGGVQ